MEVERHETEDGTWAIARRSATPALKPYLLERLEGWEQVRGRPSCLREVPFPGVPLILNLGLPWEIDGPEAPGERHDSFVAGMHAAPSVVRGAASWACIELRFTPLGARRVLGWPMHELANRAVPLDDVLPEADELTTRLRETPSWAERFDLVERFLERRLADSQPPSPGVEWSWQRLRATGGRASIGELASELGWSHRRLIARFREHVGVAPKTAARVLRFSRAVTALRASSGSLVEVAVDCGYFDQAHLNREFRALAGTTPTAFVAALTRSGGVAA